MIWLVVAGRLGSGKTTLARLLAPALDASVLTVSGLICELSASLGVVDPTRQDLQELGEAFLVGGPESLGRLILSATDSSTSVIIDGLRVADVAQWLGRQLPDGTLRVVFLDASPTVRQARCHARGDRDDFYKVDAHPVEVLAERFREMAEVVDANRSPEEVESDVLSLLTP